MAAGAYAVIPGAWHRQPPPAPAGQLETAGAEQPDTQKPSVIKAIYQHVGWCTGLALVLATAILTIVLVHTVRFGAVSEAEEIWERQQAVRAYFSTIPSATLDAAAANATAMAEFARMYARTTCRAAPVPRQDMSAVRAAISLDTGSSCVMFPVQGGGGTRDTGPAFWRSGCAACQEYKPLGGSGTRDWTRMQSYCDLVDVLVGQRISVEGLEGCSLVENEGAQGGSTELPPVWGVLTCTCK